MRPGFRQILSSQAHRGCACGGRWRKEMSGGVDWRCALVIRCCLTGSHKPSSLRQCPLISWQVCRSELGRGVAVFCSGCHKVKSGHWLRLCFSARPWSPSKLPACWQNPFSHGCRTALPILPLPYISSSQYGYLLSSKPAVCLNDIPFCYQLEKALCT